MSTDTQDDINSWMDNLYYNFEDETDREELEHAMKEHDYAQQRHTWKNL